MQIKKYEAVDMPSAVRMIKNDLGSDAVILSTRNVRKGKGTFGLFGRSMVEVTAAVDRDPQPREPKKFGRTLSETIHRTSPPSSEGLPNWVNPLRRDLQELREEMDAFHSERSGSQELQGLMEELNSVKEMMKTHLPVRCEDELSRYPEPLRKTAQCLIENEVSPLLVDQLIRRISRRFPASSYGTDKTLQGTVRRILGNLFRVREGIRRDGDGPKKVALVGPTGVGKTTTLAKIAAESALAGNERVALVTIDTYRIAAIEQLKIYARIIGIPVDVVVRPEELHRVLAKHHDKDLILIDTAGRSHRNRAQIRELERALQGEEKMERHLVLSATTKQSDLSRILRNFKPVDYDCLIFSKIDEGSRFGTLLNSVLQAGKPISYLTDGQRVPEDLHLPRVEDLVELVLAPNRVRLSSPIQEMKPKAMRAMQ
ncbi:MAG: flagellar biosynthesis protein FlhF [Deltaproteobacteria bacterium]|nr:flagellar biosynthesis protein FlhF [Deltaproteobacteria bacterium]